MAPPNSVKVLDVCKLAPLPRSHDSAADTSLPMTFFDVLWLRFPPNQRLFFYEASHPKTTLSEIILPKLKHSLSATLQHYLPLAGNLTWPPDSHKPVIQCVEGDAISLTVAESEADHFYHLSGNGFRETEEFHPFLPYLPASETRVPVLALQVTLFPNAGFSIGYTAHHGVLDGKTTAMFMYSWALICRRDGDSTLTPELTPFYDRTVINDPSGVEKAYLNFLLAQDGPNNRSLMIWDLKAPPDVMLGTFQLTQANIENIKKARLEPPVPSTYFGNCITGCIIDADLNELMGEDGVAIAARAIGEAIRGLDDGVLNGAEDLLSNFFSIQTGVLFSIAGSPRFQFYNTDFGWGRPRKVELVSIEKSGAFSLSNPKEGIGGVEIGLALKKHETEAFASLFASGLESHRAHKN